MLTTAYSSGPDQVMVDKATLMAKDLLEVVQEEWNKAKAALESGSLYGHSQQQNHGQQGYNQGPPQQQYQGYGQQNQYQVSLFFALFERD